MKKAVIGKKGFIRAVSIFVSLQVMILGLPLSAFSGSAEKSNLRGINLWERARADLDKDLANSLLDGGSVRTFDILKSTIREKKLAAGFVQVDWNAEERISKNIPLFKALLGLDEAEFFIVTTHKGRPAEDIKELKALYIEKEGMDETAAEQRAIEEVLKETSLKKEVDLCRDLLEKEGLENVGIELLPYDLFEARLRILEARHEEPEKKHIFVMENIRAYLAEEDADLRVRADFESKLVRLTGREAADIFCINDAFDKIHRPKNASLEMISLVPAENRAGGFALAEDLKNVKAYQDKLKRLMFVGSGGKKFDKFKYLAQFLDGVLDPEGMMAVFGALANPVLAGQGKNIGRSLMPKEKDKKAVDKGIAVMRESSNVFIPEDFVVENREGYYSELADDMMQVDVGPRTIEKIVAFLDSLGEGDGIILNGGTGIFSDYPDGTFALIEAASRAAEERDAAVIFAGGDMNDAVEMYLAQGGYLSPKVFRSTGGGALFELLIKKVESMPLAQALIMEQGSAVAMADGGITAGPYSGVIRFIKNNVDLGKGADTGSSNVWHARWADGTMINHSEARRFLEQLLTAKLAPAVSSIIPFEGYDSDSRVKEYVNFETGLSGAALDEAMRVIDDGLEAVNMGELLETGLSYRELFVERLVRKVVNIVMREQLDQSLERMQMYGFSEFELCMGETDEQRERGATEEVVEQDIVEMLQTRNKLPEGKGFGAYEPRWSIGTGKTPTLAEIESSLDLVWDTSEKVLGFPLYPLYGGSFKSKMEAKDPVTGKVIETITSRDVLRLPHCYGALIGGAGMSPDTIEPLIYDAIEVGKETGKKIAYGLNWKATNIPTDLAPSQEFVRMFMRIGEENLKKVQISIGTPIVAELMLEIMDPLNSWANELYSLCENAGLEVEKARHFLRYSKKIYDLVQAGKAAAVYKAANTASYKGGLIVSESKLMEGDVEPILKAADLGTAEMVFVGNKARMENLKALFGNRRIRTAESYDQAVDELTKLDVDRENIVLLATPEDDLSSLSQQDIKKIISSGMTILAVSKALNEIFRKDDLQKAFAGLIDEMKKKEIITYSEKSREALLTEMEKGGVFQLSDGLEYASEEKAAEVAQLVSEIKAFLGEF